MQEEEYTIPEMVDDVREGKMQRRQFMKRLALMGVSAAGVGAIAAAAASRQFATQPVAQGNLQDAVDHLQRHDEHIARQSQGDLNQLQNDYDVHAVVEDSMYPHPFVGREAILARKSVGMAAIPGLKISVTNRIVHGNQLTVEWVASGTHTVIFLVCLPQVAHSPFQVLPWLFVVMAKLSVSRFTMIWRKFNVSLDPENKSTHHLGAGHPLAMPLHFM